MCLQATSFLSVDIVIHGMDAAVAEDGEILAKADICDFDTGEKIRFLGPIENISQGGKDSVIVMSIVPELCYRLSNKHIKPV